MVSLAELGPADLLRTCEGFEVRFPDGKKGRVVELRYGSHPTRPDVLLLRTGRLGRRVVAVPADEVEAILPDERRLVLRSREPGQAAGGAPPRVLATAGGRNGEVGS